jgi:hypothetical protein
MLHGPRQISYSCHVTTGSRWNNAINHRPYSSAGKVHVLLSWDLWCQNTHTYIKCILHGVLEKEQGKSKCRVFHRRWKELMLNALLPTLKALSAGSGRHYPSGCWQCQGMTMKYLERWTVSWGGGLRNVWLRQNHHLTRVQQSNIPLQKSITGARKD